MLPRPFSPFCQSDPRQKTPRSGDSSFLLFCALFASARPCGRRAVAAARLLYPDVKQQQAQAARNSSANYNRGRVSQAGFAADPTRSVDSMVTGRRVTPAASESTTGSFRLTEFRLGVSSGRICAFTLISSGFGNGLDSD